MLVLLLPAWNMDVMSQTAAAIFILEVTFSIEANSKDGKSKEAQAAHHCGVPAPFLGCLSELFLTLRGKFTPILLKPLFLKALLLADEHNASDSFSSEIQNIN